MRQLILFLLICQLTALSLQKANAMSLGSERFRLSGFGTLGVTSAGKKQFGHHKELTHKGQFDDVSIFPDSVIGLQLDADLFANLSVTVQAVAEERTKYDFDNFVDWAYLRYQITPNTVARAGRMGIDLFMLSEYRNVGFAYLWTHPVVEFYTPISLSHYDGFDLKYSRQVQPGYLEFKIYGGQTGSDISVSRGKLSNKMRPFFGANASFETEHWKTRLTFATTTVDTIHSRLDGLINTLNLIPQSVWPQAAALSNRLNGEDKRISYYSAGFAYDNNTWLIQSEVALMSSNWPSVNLTTGYFSIGRRIGPVTLYSIAARAKSRDGAAQVSPLLSSPELDALQSATQHALNAPLINQRSLSVGLRWDLHPKMALKAQWDHTWVKKNGGGLLVLKEPLDSDITLNTFSLNLNFIF